MRQQQRKLLGARNLSRISLCDLAGTKAKLHLSNISSNVSLAIVPDINAPSKFPTCNFASVRDRR